MQGKILVNDFGFQARLYHNLVPQFGCVTLGKLLTSLYAYLSPIKMTSTSQFLKSNLTIISKSRTFLTRALIFQLQYFLRLGLFIHNKSDILRLTTFFAIQYNTVIIFTLVRLCHLSKICRKHKIGRHWKEKTLTKRHLLPYDL